MCAVVVGSGLYMGNSHARDNDTTRTYAVFGTMGDSPIHFLIEEMNKHGFCQVTNPRANQMIDVVWTSIGNNGHFDPLSYNIPCLVKNVTDVKSYSIIADKKSLHALIAHEDRRAYELYFARTEQMDKFKYPRAHASVHTPVYILRPSGLGFFSGRDILRVSNAFEFARAKKYYERNHIPLYNVIVSEYFDEPYLWDGRKFHLRLYMLVRADPAFRARDSWELWRDNNDDYTRPRGKILTAAKPYERGHYNDKDIHDTHAKSTNRALFFPTHAYAIHPSSSDSKVRLDLRDIYAQLEDICATLAHQLECAKLHPYKESQRAFDIFGLDVLIVHTSTRDPAVILIEVNDRVGYATIEDPITNIFFQDFYAWAYNRGVKPLLDQSMQKRE